MVTARVWSYSNTPLSRTWQMHFTPGLPVVAFTLWRLPAKPNSSTGIHAMTDSFTARKAGNVLPSLEESMGAFRQRLWINHVHICSSNRSSLPALIVQVHAHMCSRMSKAASEEEQWGASLHTLSGAQHIDSNPNSGKKNPKHNKSTQTWKLWQ